MHHAYDAFLAATMGNFVERFMPWLDSESSAAIRFRKAQEARKDDDDNKVDLSSKHGMIPGSGGCGYQGNHPKCPAGNLLLEGSLGIP